MEIIEICFLIIIVSFVVAQLIQAILSVQTAKLLKKHTHSMQNNVIGIKEGEQDAYRRCDLIITELDNFKEEILEMRDHLRDQTDQVHAIYMLLRNMNEEWNDNSHRLREKAEVIKRPYKKRKIKAIEHKEE